jgi:hypothetical protein
LISVYRFRDIGVTLQILQVILSAIGVHMWITEAIYFAWNALILVIGFLVGRGGGKVVHGGFHGAAMYLWWFFINAVAWTVLPELRRAAPEDALLHLGGLAISCLVFGVIAFLVASIATATGRKYRVQTLA